MTTSKVADLRGEGVALTADLKQMIAEKLTSQADKSATCPQLTRRGCSLTAGTGKLLAQSKLAVSQWMELTQCLAGRITQHRCEKRCGVCLYSV